MNPKPPTPTPICPGCLYPVQSWLDIEHTATIEGVLWHQACALQSPSPPESAGGKP